MNWEKWLKYGLYAGIFAIPFIPFIVSSSMFFPFITGKNFIFRILVELMLGGWVLLALLDARYRPQFSYILASIAAFVGVIFVADLFAENTVKALWSNFERMEGWVTLAHLLVYFVILGSMLNVEKLWRRYLHTTVGVSVLVVFFGLLQLAGVFTINQGGDRLDATFGNATYLAVYMLFHIFFTAYLMIRHEGEKYMYAVYGVIIALQMLILFFTGTRGTVLGLIGGVLLATLLIALFGKGRRLFRKTAIGVLLLVIVAVGGFIAVKDSEVVQNNFILGRFASISLEEGSTRFTIWGMAWQGVQERPVLGWGQDGFNYVFNKYYDPALYNQEPWFDRVHNVVFDWLIAGGFVGLIAYFLIPLFTMYYLWFYKREQSLFTVEERSVLTGLLAAYFFHNLFVFDNIFSYILYITVLALIHVRVVSGTGRGGEKKGMSRAMVQTVALPIVIVATLAVVYVVNIPGIATSQKLIQALSPQETIEGNIARFEEALAYESIGNQEVVEQYLQSAILASRLQIPEDVKQKFVDGSRAAIDEELARNPNDARLYILASVMLSSNGKHDASLPYTLAAAELSPKKQQILFKLGEYYINTGQFEKGLETFKEAFELAPEYEEARILYALAAMNTNNGEIAAQLLIDHFGTLAVNDDRLLNMYAEIRRFDLVLEIWKERAAESPNDIQIQVSFAAAHLAAGERGEAVRILEEVIERNPNFKEQGSALIQQINAGVTL